MENLSEALNSLLKDPNILKQVQSLSSSLSSDNKQNKANNEDTDISSMLSCLLSDSDENTKEDEDDTTPRTDTNTLQMITKLAPLLSSVKKEDKNTYLLNSLRPFLSSTRRKKLDESIKMMQLMKILPLIKDTGILSSLF